MIAGGSPESPLEGPWRVPGGSLEGPWDAPGASEHQSRPPLKKWQNSFEKLNALEAKKSQFWDPAGIQKCTKNQSLAQKVRPGTDFLSNFHARIDFPTFRLNFYSFFGEN